MTTNAPKCAKCKDTGFYEEGPDIDSRTIFEYPCDLCTKALCPPKPAVRTNRDHDEARRLRAALVYHHERVKGWCKKAPSQAELEGVAANAHSTLCTPLNETVSPDGELNIEDVFEIWNEWTFRTDPMTFIDYFRDRVAKSKLDPPEDTDE